MRPTSFLSRLLLIFSLWQTPSQAAPAGAPASRDPLTRALDFLGSEVPAWKRDNGCFSCHNNGDGARALLAARQQGYSIPTSALDDTLTWLSAPDRWDRNQGSPEASDERLANLQFGESVLAAIGAGALTNRAALENAARRVARGQDASGAWPVEPSNPAGSPATHGDALATFAALRILEAARLPDHAEAVGRARRWLEAMRPGNIPAAATAVLYAVHTGKPPPKPAVDLIVTTQTSDGGWGPYRDSPPEVFDTSLALLALARMGREPELSERRTRGRAFLVASQEPAGSWPATTRPSRGQSYAQQLSTTAWATLALLALEERARAGDTPDHPSADAGSKR